MSISKAKPEYDGITEDYFKPIMYKGKPLNPAAQSLGKLSALARQNQHDSEYYRQLQKKSVEKRKQNNQDVSYKRKGIQ